MNRTGLPLLVTLLVSSGCSRSAPPPPAPLSAADEASWNRVVAALQQVSEENREALELGEPPAIQRRLAQLAGLLDHASGLRAAIGTPCAAGNDGPVKGIRERILGID